MAGLSEAKLTRLKNALPREYSALDKLRKQRSRLLSVGAGPNYPHRVDEDGWEGCDDLLPIMQQAAKAEAISLAANCPRIRCMATRVDRLPFARHYEDALNLYSRNMHLEEAAQECVINAFFSMGIMKVYMAESVPIWLESSEWMDPGKPFAQSLSPHHLVYDTGATAYRNCQLIADRYRVRFDDVTTDTRFSSKVRKRLKEVGPLTTVEMAKDEPWRMLKFDDTDIMPMMYLSDVFLPDEGRIYTFAVDSSFNVLGDGPLSDPIEWTGREEGPFHFLNLGPVPDKTTPSSPAQNLELLANAGNSLYRRLLDQAKAQRTLIQVPSAIDDKEITAAQNARDLSFIRSDAPLVQTRIGGADQNNFAFMLNTLEQGNKFAGNTDMRLGLGAVTDSVGQEGLVAQGVSRSEGYHQQIFAKFMRGVVKELGRLLFEAKTVRFDMTRRIDEHISVDDPWLEAVEEGSRLGEFTDYDLDIEVESMPYKSSSQRVQELQQTLAEIAPWAPLVMQQGLMPNIPYYLQEKARLLNNSCLENLLMSVAPPQEQAGGGHERTMGPGGPREYIHRSAGGGGGQDPAQQQMAMMSAASADNQAA